LTKYLYKHEVTMDYRSYFPIFSVRTPFHYLDTAASAQKPASVIDAMNNFYRTEYANVHRGIYSLAEHATEHYEKVRHDVARFINAQSAQEIVFTRGTTESINLVAQTWGRHNIKAGDAVVITALEHHANLLPWQQLCNEKQAELKVIPVLLDGTLDEQIAFQLIDKGTKLVAVAHSSNFLGTHIDVKKIARLAHAVGALCLVDAAQSVAHQTLDVQDLDCDFLAFSGHKMYGPTGIGVLYGKKYLLDGMPPYQYGGGMVYEADYHLAVWQKTPKKFEAGTPPIAQVIGLGSAVEFLQTMDRQAVAKQESLLCLQLIEALEKIPKVKILGPVSELKRQGHLVSFIVEGIHPHDVAAYVDRFGVCIRAGHQCAQPLARRLNLEAAVRASFGCYSRAEDVEALVHALKKL
jgi:cysteine desulfurase / selenocysteine lyase